MIHISLRNITERKFSYLTEGRKHLSKDNLFIPHLNIIDILSKIIMIPNLDIHALTIALSKKADKELAACIYKYIFHYHLSSYVYRVVAVLLHRGLTLDRQACYNVRLSSSSKCEF